MTASRVSRTWAIDQLAAAVLVELATSAVPDATGDEVTAEADLSELPWHLRQEVVDRAAVLAHALAGPPDAVARAIAALVRETQPTTEE